LEVGEAGENRVGVASAREPAVAEIHHALQRVPALAAQQHRRVWFLRGLRVRPDRIEVDELAVVLRLVLRPDLLHREDPLAEEPEARLEGGPVFLHLFSVPPSPDAEQEASVGEQVEARDRLRQRDRIVLDDETDPGPELQVLRRGRRGGEPDEWVERVGILLGQWAAARERRAPARRNVRVLGHEQGLEPALLDGARQLVDTDSIVRRADDDTVVSASSNWVWG